MFENIFKSSSKPIVLPYELIQDYTKRTWNSNIVLTIDKTTNIENMIDNQIGKWMLLYPFKKLSNKTITITDGDALLFQLLHLDKDKYKLFMEKVNIDSVEKRKYINAFSDSAYEGYLKAYLEIVESTPIIDILNLLTSKGKEVFDETSTFKMLMDRLESETNTGDNPFQDLNIKDIENRGRKFNQLIQNSPAMGLETNPDIAPKTGDRDLSSLFNKGEPVVFTSIKDYITTEVAGLTAKKDSDKFYDTGKYITIKFDSTEYFKNLFNEYGYGDITNSDEFQHTSDISNTTAKYYSEKKNDFKERFKDWQKEKPDPTSTRRPLVYLEIVTEAKDKKDLKEEESNPNIKDWTHIRVHSFNSATLVKKEDIGDVITSMQRIYDNDIKTRVKQEIDSVLTKPRGEDKIDFAELILDYVTPSRGQITVGEIDFTIKCHDLIDDEDKLLRIIDNIQSAPDDSSKFELFTMNEKGEIEKTTEGNKLFENELTKLEKKVKEWEKTRNKFKNMKEFRIITIEKEEVLEERKKLNRDQQKDVARAYAKKEGKVFNEEEWEDANPKEETYGIKENKNKVKEKEKEKKKEFNLIVTENIINPFKLFKKGMLTNYQGKDTSVEGVIDDPKRPPSRKIKNRMEQVLERLQLVKSLIPEEDEYDSVWVANDRKYIKRKKSERLLIENPNNEDKRNYSVESDQHPNLKPKEEDKKLNRSKLNAELKREKISDFKEINKKGKEQLIILIKEIVKITKSSNIMLTVAGDKTGESSQQESKEFKEGKAMLHSVYVKGTKTVDGVEQDRLNMNFNLSIEDFISLKLNDYDSKQAIKEIAADRVLIQYGGGWVAPYASRDLGMKGKSSTRGVRIIPIIEKVHTQVKNDFSFSTKTSKIKSKTPINRGGKNKVAISESKLDKKLLTDVESIINNFKFLQKQI